MPKRINGYSQSFASFHLSNITLTLSIGIDLYSQSHNNMEHSAKLKASSPCGPALVLSFDFWKIIQWPTPAKAALSPVEYVASSACKPNQSTWFWYLFHRRFCALKSKLTKTSCHTTHRSINKSTKVIALNMLRQQIFLNMNKILPLLF